MTPAVHIRLDGLILPNIEYIAKEIEFALNLSPCPHLIGSPSRRPKKGVLQFLVINREQGLNCKPESIAKLPFLIIRPIATKNSELLIPGSSTGNLAKPNLRAMSGEIRLELQHYFSDGQNPIQRYGHDSQ